ncbi:DUF2157 domain-containing protein [Lutibacter sp. HS1-25]|uniref:DUF2157 domain-containing protein n=1 Tax=Lutibacter sp. HS1-25 TaxID=2485000 RepID=UPI001011C780|nr:DUF2157 domain-containing protein [Lutibacter sp. HS1-25]RXP53797.1 DUF2157 domain-containing protein [Lutibacter sp. HS1-25]
MVKLSRDDIYIISQNSNWSAKGVQSILKQNIYSSPTSWQQFLRLFFLSLGIGFATFGVLFFFAYNWADLHKFVKLGLMEGLIIITTFVVLFSKFNDLIKNLALTSASILVGVLFAVFGQIYQTGANAYDFFLGWTLFISLWVLISNFAPLWLIYLTLINTTLVLYSQQVAQDWSGVFISTLLLLVNSLFFIFFIVGFKKITKISFPKWFFYTIALAAIFSATIGIVIGIFSKFDISFWTLFVLTSILYASAVWYSLQINTTFYLAIIAFSLVVIITSFLIKIFKSDASYLIVTLFIIGSITFSIKLLLDLQKKWTNG